MATSKKVLVSSSEFPEVGMKILRDKFQILQTKNNGFDSGTMDDFKKEIEELIPGVEGIIWSTKLHLGNELLNKAGNQLKVIGSMSAGVDHIDVKNVKARNIALGNTPDVLNGAVADVAVVLMIGAARRLTEGIQQVKSGEWELGPQKMLGQDIKGSTVGIVGLGGIGQTIVRRLSGFEVGKIIYTGHKEKPEGIELGAEFVTFDELLNRSDFVILSCPLNEATKNMMNAEVFKKMKKTSILINVSRGGVIDQDALVKALETKEIWAAGLDVTTPEPLPKDNPLVLLPNCFLTPHLGSATVNTRNEMAQLAALNVVLGIQGEPLLTPIIQTKKNGFDVGAIDDFKKEIEELIPGVDGIIWRTRMHLGSELLDKAGCQLKVIGVMAAGVNHVEMNEVKARKIAIGNTPEVLNGAVADMAIMLMIGAARRVMEGIQQVKIGNWIKRAQNNLGPDIKGSTVGIIGLGGIGQTITRRLSGFEAGEIIYTGPKEKPEGNELGAEYVTFDELLNQSDFVILSCPLNDATKNMMNAEVFRKMKSTSILINVSRGGVIDQDALVRALETKEIWAAGLDVTVPEPLPKDHPLVSISNCFLTPHLGTATVNRRNEMAQLAALNVVLGLQGEAPDNTYIMKVIKHHRLFTFD